MNDTIKPQQTSFAMRNSMLEDESVTIRTAGSNNFVTVNNKLVRD